MRRIWKLAIWAFACAMAFDGGYWLFTLIVYPSAEPSTVERVMMGWGGITVSVHLVYVWINGAAWVIRRLDRRPR